MRTEPPRMLTLAEVAQALTVSRTTVYAIIRRGDLHPVKIGRRAVINLDDLNRYIAERTEAAS